MRPKKSLGQHFLTNPSICKRIVEACQIAPDDEVLEIGPGRGALTGLLRQKTDHLHLAEKDEFLAAQFIEKGIVASAQVWIGDVLTYLLDESRSWIVVGNLPYNVSLPIIFHFMTHATAVRRMIFMVQKEVADRLASPPGSKAYGIPSVCLQAEAKLRRLFDVGPGNFFPPPTVDSSVIEIIPHASPFTTEDERRRFAAIVKQAFSARRKTIANTLPQYRDLFSQLGLTGKERAEVLSVERYLQLLNINESKKESKGMPMACPHG